MTKSILLTITLFFISSCSQGTNTLKSIDNRLTDLEHKTNRIEVAILQTLKVVDKLNDLNRSVIDLQIIEEETDLEVIIALLDSNSVSVVRAACERLKEHMSERSLLLLIKSLPAKIEYDNRYNTMEKVALIRLFIWNSNMYNQYDPNVTPDFGYNKSEWLEWYNSKMGKFKFKSKLEQFQYK
jgi:hypothetical protein